MLIEKEKIAAVQEGALGADQLRSVEKNFRLAGEDFPVVVGHIGAMLSGGPAAGWIKKDSLFFDGKYLKADVDLVDDELVDFVRKGKYGNKSIGIYMTEDGEWHFHHLAIIGGEPPRIKGLGKIQLNSGIPENAKITMFSLDIEEKTKKTEKKESKEKTKKKSKERIEKMDEVEKLKKQLEMEQKKNKEYSEKMKELEKQQKLISIERFSSKINDLKSAAMGKIPKEKLNEFCEVLEKEKETFADNEQIESLVGQVKELFSAIPELTKKDETLEMSDKPKDAYCKPENFFKVENK